MADPHIRAAFYLSPTLDALWRWSDDAQVLSWAEGEKTIAFRAEVEAVLTRLAPSGLPPFGAVALLLAACRDGWTTSHGRDVVAGYARVFGGMQTTSAPAVPISGPQSLFSRIARDVAQLLEGLDRVNALPRELREGLASKALLAEVVFEGAKNRSTPEEAALIVQALSEGVNAETLRPQLCNEEALAQFAQHVDGLHEGLARIDAESLARRARTGIDEPVHPPDDDLSPPERVRQLLAALAGDPELAGLARLAHDLMAAVSVPRALRAREELPVGGVSDLSNRGPLDRLLVSELAHDDLTLAVRVAVNEALYLRRESPPRKPPNRRALLIDAGIRMWGVPRVFAAAAALALAATNDPKADFAAYRAVPSGLEPVDLTTRRGLEAHLGSLETAPHPGDALAPFLDALALADDAATDAIILTQQDVLTDAGFRAAVHALGLPSIYVATVDRDGAFTLCALTKAGVKPMARRRCRSMRSSRAPPRAGFVQARCR